MPAQFQRITKVEIGNRLIRGVTADEQFRRVLYEEVSFLRRRFTRCRWSDCRFKRTAFRHGTRFENCHFEECKFELAHTYMGGPSFFKDCRFEGCLFDSVQFWNSTFEGCSFTGKFVNVVFYGPGAPAGWQAELRDVDFSSAQFELVDFRGEIDLSTTRLPPGFVPPNVPGGAGAK
jgi:uncharacterized protein YjbI with pentapeptide repeats